MSADLSPDERRDQLERQLGFMAAQIKNWLKWDREHRSREQLTTDDGTHIMALPVPFWPTHGAFESWIQALEGAAAPLREDAHAT